MQTLQIDIVSDISCPWCIIGYNSLQLALDEIKDKVDAKITWHPFELNSQMPPEGQEINEHLSQKYGINEQQINQNREAIRERGLSVGYEFGNRGGGRIYNTFDAHRLLHWAKETGSQTALKLAFFDLYFKHSGNPSDHKQMLEVIESIGLDAKQAKEILASDKYAIEVRQEQQHYQSQGISSVPAVIINNKHLISGGQPSEVFKNALLQISQEKG
ncbi:MAG: putative DsbA family dithiol-disulfide isomerase [Alphaproteobacteria bacterium]|jgi:predicted DsbA family dithiol-disulfide isomerase